MRNGSWRESISILNSCHHLACLLGVLYRRRNSCRKMKYAKGADFYVARRFFVAAGSLGGTALVLAKNDAATDDPPILLKQNRINESCLLQDHFARSVQRLTSTLCQSQSSSLESPSPPPAVPPESISNCIQHHSTNEQAPYLSWIRRTLASVWLASLPIPRVVLNRDPDLTLSQRRIRERQRADQKLNDLQVQIRTALERGEQKAVGDLLKQSYELLYGPGVDSQYRQSFLERYGCTGWTEDVLVHLLELGATRGFVEIGAGNGQWARILNDRYNESEYAQHQKKRAFEFCLAYDNMSQLPLNPDYYHKHTQPYHDYFYSNVLPCESIPNTLMHWQCRGRVLLLVYPSLDDMAVTAIQEYARVSTLNDTVVYVGEGRGGANANDAFFDYLENGEWIFCKILPVKSYGTKGYEKLYVLKRRFE